jgi:hypothetical protein
MTTRVIPPPVAPVAPIYPCLYRCFSTGGIALATSANGGVLLTDAGHWPLGRQFSADHGTSWEAAGWVRIEKRVMIEFTP